MLKNRSLLILVIILLVAVLTVLSCGRKGSLNPNVPPYVEISDYSGIARPDSVETDSAMSHVIGDLINPDIYDSLFYQEIFWRAWDVDGVVKSFAYRIGTWDSLSEDWLYDQSYGVHVSEAGWVLHLQPNGEYGIWTPLDERFPKTAVYFTATDTSDYKKNFGKFEVKCKDNYGEECIKSAIRYFVSWSDVPSTSISTSQGKLDTVRVGTALNFEFTVIKDDDPFGYGSEAAYFKYRLKYYKTLGTDTLDIPLAGIDMLISATDWYSTRGFSDPTSLELKKEYDDHSIDRPELKVNQKFVDGTFEITQIVVKTVDKAGIVDPDSASLSFFVRDYFTPETCPFICSTYEWPNNYSRTLFGSSKLDITPHIYVLGENSYLTYMSSSKDEIPSKIVSGKKHFADRFYIDMNGNVNALYSNDIEIYMKWRYLGERQYVQTKNIITQANRTYYYDAHRNVYEQYYCDIQYMDIQLDGGVGTLPPVGTEITDEITYEHWRRIPIYEDQSCRLFGLSSGEHIFKVRAVDVQGAVDPSPEIFEFNLVKIVDSGEKTGILLVDDTSNQPIYAVEDSVNGYYVKFMEELDEYTIYDLSDDNFSAATLGNQVFRGDIEMSAPYFAPSDIQNYKLVIWHANNPKQKFPSGDGTVHLVNNYDVLGYFLRSGGNLLYTGCYGICDPSYAKAEFLQTYAGLADTLSGLNSLDFFWINIPSVNNSPLGGVSGINSFANIEIDSFNTVSTIINPFPEYWMFTPLQAIGSITFLNIIDDAEEIFTSVPGPFFPDPDPYYGAPIAAKYTKEPGVTGTVYTFGFPFFYFNVDQTREILNQVMNEVGMK